MQYKLSILYLVQIPEAIPHLPQKMSPNFNINSHVFSERPFPQDHLFDPLHDFDPFEKYKSMKNTTLGSNLEQIDHFLVKLVLFFVK